MGEGGGEFGDRTELSDRALGEHGISLDSILSTPTPTPKSLGKHLEASVKACDSGVQGRRPPRPARSI